MNKLSIQLLLPMAACVFSAAAWSASQAGSSASSATSAASQSVGASSTSLTTSSNSSSGNKVAAGDYTIVDIAIADAAADGSAGPARLTLRAASGPAGQQAEFVLLLPRDTVARAGLAAGDPVTVRQRAYGLEFAAGAGRQAFFLVLDDAWYRELASTVVVL